MEEKQPISFFNILEILPEYELKILYVYHILGL